MDSQLEQLWKSAASPFDGDCLHLADYVQLPPLRSSLITIVDTIRRNKPFMPLYCFDDWHEHDGYVTRRSTTDWDALDKILADDDALYAARHGDTFVHWAYYPNDLSFLFRFYVLDADEDSAYPGIWGDCDLCASPTLIATVKNTAAESVAPQLAVTNAKEYFDGVYAG